MSSEFVTENHNIEKPGEWRVVASWSNPLDAKPKAEVSEFPIRPVGFQLLVKMLKTQKKVGSLIIPESRVADENTASMFCRVIAMGPNCYDPSKDRFADGPWCKIGEIVVIQSFTGRRFETGDGDNKEEFRLIKDEAVDGVIDDETRLYEIRRAW